MHSIAQEIQKRKRQIVVSITLIGLGIVSFSSTGYASGIAFPKTRTVRDSSDMLKTYQAYLDFIVWVGKRSHLSSTTRLEKAFQDLKNKNPESAARFLKGLRFEMMDKAERMGRNDGTLTSTHPEIQKWIARFIDDWAREADEHVYRVYSSQLAKK